MTFAHLRLLSKHKADIKTDNMFLEGKTIVVTGATGLIGKNLIPELIRNGGHVIAVVRNLDKAQSIFSSYKKIVFLTNDLSTDVPIQISDTIDHIVHAGCPTSSEYMQTHPVETIQTIVNGTRKVLELAKEQKVKSVVFLSSMEVYGTIIDDTNAVTENMAGPIDLLNARNSYPLGKRLAETLCYAYYEEYNVPVCIARLTQTFGPGVNINEDNRVFAQFARNALRHEDIILHTEGGTRRMYLHSQDAVCAIICLMQKGKAGEVYNVANEDTYISIKEMAEMVRQYFTPFQQVVINKKENTPYLPEIHMRLNTEKIRQLGWHPRYGILDMYKSIINVSK